MQITLTPLNQKEWVASTVNFFICLWVAPPFDYYFLLRIMSNSFS
jgi:hypothetical protein